MVDANTKVTDDAALTAAVAPRFGVSDRDLERVLCGEAPADLVARVDALAKAQPELAAHLAERRAARAAFFTLHPRRPAPVKATSLWSTLTERMGNARFLTAASAVAAVALVVVVMLPPSDAVRVKGDGAASAALIVRRGERVFRPSAGALLRQDDAVRIEVTCPGAGAVSVALAELDANLSGGQRTPTLLVQHEVIAAGTQVLSGSFVLDAHLGREELWIACRDTQALAEQAGLAMVAGDRAVASVVIPVVKGP